MATAEAKVMDLLTQHNKPFNAQSVADFLAPQGLKKTQVGKTLDALAEAGRVTAKEFGKTKIYFLPQSGLAVMSKEESDAKQAEVAALKASVQQESAAVRELETELNEWSSSMTVEEIEASIKKLTAQSADLGKRLEGLQSGAVLVTKEERAAVEKLFCERMEAWRKRRTLFRTIWDTLSESLDGKQSELFEEMGVETDESAGVSYKEVEALLPKRRRF